MCVLPSSEGGEGGRLDLRVVESVGYSIFLHINVHSVRFRGEMHFSFPPRKALATYRGEKGTEYAQETLYPQKRKQSQQGHRNMDLDVSSSFRNNRWRCSLQFPISHFALFLKAGEGGGQRRVGVSAVLDASILKWYLAICVQVLLP